MNRERCETWILRVESRLNLPYGSDDAYVRVEGQTEELWELFTHWSRRFENIGETLTVAPEYLCDPDAMTFSERRVREASLDANSLEDFQWLRAHKPYGHSEY
jgi:hypothetical protein